MNYDFSIRNRTISTTVQEVNIEGKWFNLTDVFTIVESLSYSDFAHINTPDLGELLVALKVAKRSPSGIYHPGPELDAFWGQLVECYSERK